MTAPLTPERLARLLDEAVQTVTQRPGTFDRISRGIRRRRVARRASVPLLAAAMIAIGGVTALAVAPDGPPASRLPMAVPTAQAAQSTQAAYSAPSDQQGMFPPAKLQPAKLRSAPPRPASSSVAAQIIPPAINGGDLRALDSTGLGPATIEPVGNAEITSSFLLVVHTASFGTQAVPFSAAPAKNMPPAGPVIVGSADAAGDGLTELFVQVDMGCCTEFWTIFRLVNGRLSQVSLSGKPVRLAVSDTASGFSCGGPAHDLVTYGYQNESSGTFLATTSTYRWAGASLVLVSRQRTTVRGLAARAQLAGYTGVSCGDLPRYQYAA